MSEFHAAAQTGDMVGMTKVLDAGADIDAQDGEGRTAAMIAAYVHQTEAARLLFSRGAHLNQRDSMLNSPFLFSGAEGLLEMLIAAAEAGADPMITNRYGGVANIPVAEHGHLEVIRYWPGETTIDENHVNNPGWSALLEGIILNDGGPVHQEVVGVLLAPGANPNLGDSVGVSPLYQAQSRGRIKISELIEPAGGQA